MTPISGSSDELNNFQKLVNDFSKCLANLHNQTDKLLHSEAILAELQTALEELHTAEEELHQQSDALVAVQASIEEERQRYKDLFDFAPEGYLVTDVWGTIQEANRAASQLLNIPQHRIIGRPLAIFIARSEQEHFRTQLSKLAQIEKPLSWDTRIIPRDQSPMDISIIMGASRDSTGKMIGIRWQMQDITRRKQVENTIRKLNQVLEKRVQERTHHLDEALKRERAIRAQAERARAEAEATNRMKLRFLAMISHELRTPLASIKGFATSLLAQDVTWSQKQQDEFLRIIDLEADRLTELISQLLDLSSLEAGTLQVSPLAHNLGSIIQSVRPQLEIITSQHHLEIELNDRLPPVLVDARRIIQVIRNLVDNAAKYSPPQTAITVTAHAEQEFVRIDVVDQGYGISPENRDRIFEAFQQAETNPEYHSKGAGLGLAICKGIVEMHGGRIWLQDNETQGTTFSFTLPRVDVSR